MKKMPIWIFILVLFTIRTGYSLRFIAYGNSRYKADTHQAIVDEYRKADPELVIHTGNCWDGYTPEVWKSHLTYWPNMDTLLNNNKILVARGNYEFEKTLKNFDPPILINDSLIYAFREGNCFFVCMGFDPGTNNNWMEEKLRTYEAQSADWRFVYANKGIYSSAPNGADGTFSNGSNVTHFRDLCDKHDVNIVFGGHNAIYERSHLIYDGKVTDSSEFLVDLSKARGTVYIMTGGAGAPLETVASKWWVNKNIATNNFCTIDALEDSIYVLVLHNNGSIVDTFSITKGDYVKVLSPNGYEEWEAGKEYEIKWNDNIDHDVKIELLLDNTVVKTVTNSVASNSPFKWTLPGDIKESRSYKLKISSVVNNSTCDISNEKFTIIPGIGIIAYNTLSKSHFDLRLYASQLHFSIPEFDGNRLYHVNIKMYTMQGKLVSTLINTSVNAGSHSIPMGRYSYSSGLYLLRVEVEGHTGTFPIVIK